MCVDWGQAVPSGYFSRGMEEKFALSTLGRIKPYLTDYSLHLSAENTIATGYFLKPQKLRTGNLKWMLIRSLKISWLKLNTTENDKIRMINYFSGGMIRK